jgi:transcription elongation factor Elf1
MDDIPDKGPDQGGGSEEAWHSYRCPVCGHTDAVEETNQGPVIIPCTHCQTVLEVHVSSQGSERTTVHVHREEPES